MDMSEPITGFYAAVRAAHIAACMLVLGVWFFHRWIVADECASPLAQASGRIGRWLLAIALPTALVTGIAWFLFVAQGMKDPDDPMQLSLLRLVWTGTQFGRVSHLRALLWIASAVFAFLFSRRATPAASSGQRATAKEKTAGMARRLNGRWISGWFLGGVSGALLASIAWTGHGATGPAPGWHRAADVVHLLACAAWPGGLIPLALLLWQVSRSRQAVPVADLAPVIQRFSATALTAVAILIATGIMNAWCLVGSFSALWNMPYGRVLVLKIAIFLIVMLLGAVNRRVGKPRLVRIVGDVSREREAAPILRRMMWIVSIESLLGLGIIGIVGVLGLLMPARM